MNEPAESGARAGVGWSAARGFLLVAGVNLVVGLGLLLQPFSGLFEGVAEFVLVLFPVLSLVWNVVFCFWIKRKGGSQALRGALAATAAAFLASTGCWLHMSSNFHGG